MFFTGEESRVLITASGTISTNGSSGWDSLLEKHLAYKSEITLTELCEMFEGDRLWDRVLFLGWACAGAVYVVLRTLEVLR